MNSSVSDRCIGLYAYIWLVLVYTLRKLAHLIYREFLAIKIEKFIGKCDFIILAQNIIVGTKEPPRRGSHNLCLDEN